jgi:hypothetical protein
VSLRLHYPLGFDAARRYALDVILAEFLGLEWEAVPEARSDYRLELPNGQAITWPDVFFRETQSPLLDASRLPSRPVPRVALQELLPDYPEPEPVPLLYATPDHPPLHIGDAGAALGFDLAGAVFFQLTRFEEALSTEADAHGRFPASAAIAVREGWIERPLVDEYVAILRLLLQRAGVACREPEFRVFTTHDVDLPFAYHGTPWRYRLLYLLATFRATPGLSHLRDFLMAHARGPAADPCNTFGWIMDESEKRGLKSAFYFITDRPCGATDGHYAVADAPIRTLLAAVLARGHEVGLHASYGSWQSSDQFGKEVRVLREAVTAAGGEPGPWGGRQHYLRWRTPASLSGWAEAGAAYDSTMGFAEVAGFRAGTCQEYPWFDVAQERRLALRERPLVVMDCTLTDAHYMGLGRGPEAVAAAVRLKQRCRLHGGIFTLLWHNSRLVRPDDRHLYLQILDA